MYKDASKWSRSLLVRIVNASEIQYNGNVIQDISPKGAAMNATAKLPIGIENFEDIRRNGFYYVDKTALIKDLLEGWGGINLFTRPRRFGKSLNMNMLKYFFEYG